MLKMSDESQNCDVDTLPAHRNSPSPLQVTAYISRKQACQVWQAIFSHFNQIDWVSITFFLSQGGGFAECYKLLFSQRLTDTFACQLCMFETRRSLQLQRRCCQKSSGLGGKTCRLCSKISALFSEPHFASSVFTPLGQLLPLPAGDSQVHLLTFRLSLPTAHLIMLHSSQHTFHCFVLTELYFERQKTASGILPVAAYAREHT